MFHVSFESPLRHQCTGRNLWKPIVSSKRNLKASDDNTANGQHTLTSNISNTRTNTEMYDNDTINDDRYKFELN